VTNPSKFSFSNGDILVSSFSAREQAGRSFRLALSCDIRKEANNTHTHTTTHAHL